MSGKREKEISRGVDGKKKRRRGDQNMKSQNNIL